ncbi:MAG: patatin-like phospholipase family protein [Agarilytica sp.]
MTSFTLALGGGGVKGLAHIPLLKFLDTLGLKPTAIAGTSMGAIIGALYASGLSGIEIEQRVNKHLFLREDGFRGNFRRRKHLVKWLKVFSIEKSRGGFVAADGLFEHLFTELVGQEFANLAIPFTAIATDFHSGKEIALNSGPLLPAVQASMAVPGVFAPVEIGEQLLIDGGLVNNVPVNQLYGKGQLLIASDVISLSGIKQPKTTQVLSGALSILLQKLTQVEFEKFPPDFVFQPDTQEIDAFDFHKIVQVLARGEHEISKYKNSLRALLDANT